MNIFTRHGCGRALLLLTAVLMVGAVCLSGCGEGGGDGNGDNTLDPDTYGDGSIVGDWLLETATVDGETIFASDLRYVIFSFKSSSEIDFVTFQKAGGFWMVSEVTTGANGWRTEGSTVYFVSPYSVESEMEYRIADGKLILSACVVYDPQGDGESCFEYTMTRTNLTNIRNSISPIYSTDPALYGDWTLQDDDYYEYIYFERDNYVFGDGVNRYVNNGYESGGWCTNGSKLYLIGYDCVSTSENCSVRTISQTQIVELTYTVSGSGDDKTLTINNDIWHYNSTQGKRPPPKYKNRSAFAPLLLLPDKR